MFNRIGLLPTIVAAALVAMLAPQAACADPFNLFRLIAQPAATPAPTAMSQPDAEPGVEQPARFKRQLVAYTSHEAPGTIVIDTPNTYLYYVLGNDRAIRYGIGVGREGFTWSGIKHVIRKAEWPDWHPPAEMIARQPYLPRFMAGGPGNPLGARAMYIGGTVYRIHGTNDPSTIGQNVSSGCIRLTNDDVADLYERVQVGAKVIVLPQTHNVIAQQTPRQTPMTSSYAPPSRAQHAWARISQAGLY